MNSSPGQLADWFFVPILKNVQPLKVRMDERKMGMMTMDASTRTGASFEGIVTPTRHDAAVHTAASRHAGHGTL